MSKVIPRTGRVGRFINILEKHTDSSSFLYIIENAENYKKYKKPEQAEWWRETIERMEDKIGSDTAVEVMTSCGAKCCGAGQRKTAKRLLRESTSIEEFLEKLSTYEVREGELEYILNDDGTIIARHNRCFCGQVKQHRELHRSDTYCQCSVEFNRQFFLAAFEKPVQVKLNKSILNGDDVCEFLVRVDFDS